MIFYQEIDFFPTQKRFEGTMVDVLVIIAPEISLSEGSTPGGLPTFIPTPGSPPFYTACIRPSQASPGTLQ